MKKLTLLLSFLLLAGLASAQDFFPKAKNTSGAINILELEKTFDDWAAQRDLKVEKGWKWYARWLNDQMRYVESDGSLGDQTPLFEASIAKTEAMQSTVVSRSNSWMPAGPTDYARIVTSFIIRGMGRINCITFHPTDSNTFWVGVAQGGIWKTTNGGASWMPLDNGLPILRISDIAVNPNNPDEMYASVGDYAYLGIALDLDDRKRHTHYGLGVYKSVNGGQSWQPTGLTFDQTSRDGSLTRRVFVHPDNGQRLVAAGIFGIKTSSDGGDTWQTTSTEILRDIEQHPTDPNVLYAATSTIRNIETGRSGVWKSTDFGQTWNLLETGIPENNTVYRIELAIAPSNPNVIYAIAANVSGGFYGLYRSTDGGENWEMRSTEPNILHWYEGDRDGGQGSYDLTILVDAKNPDRIYTGGINIWGSDDGGLSWRMASNWIGSPVRSSIHADQHFLAYNSLDQKFYACNDGGVSRTDSIVLGSESARYEYRFYDFETEWEDIAGGMQITSFYRLGLSRQNPGDFIAGTQDNSSWLKKEGEWTGIIGGDGMEGLIDPLDSNIIYGSSQYGNISKSVNGGNSFFRISSNIPADETEREAWTTPFMVLPEHPDMLYVAYTNLYLSRNGGNTFTAISDFPVEGQPTSSFDVSLADPDYIYLAHRIYHSSDAPSRMWRTFDGGENWTDITTGLPDDRYFTYIHAGDNNPERVWVTVGGFSEGEKVFRSDDGGDTWQNISYNLPNVPVNCIELDPNSPSNMVYIGTDIGVYYSNDNMESWELYGDGMPNVVVSELEILEEENQIYAATFGRGIWRSDLQVETVSTNSSIIEELDLTVSPNPNQGKFNLQVQGLPNQQSFELQLVDVTGRTVFQAIERSSSTNFQKAYDLDLVYGLYFLELKIENSRKVLRFVVE